MIDSINFLIRDMEWIDFKHISELGQRVKEYKNINNRTGFENKCYEFNYKGIEFKYNKSFKILTILTTAHKVLEKKDITLSDYQIYISKIYQIISEVLNTKYFKLELNRIDDCVDFDLTENEKELYLFLLKWNKTNYKYMKWKKDYASSIYIKTKKGKTNLNIYDRGAKTQKADDQNILRIEVQCKKKLLKNEYNEYGIDKELKNYWSKDSMEEYFFKFLYDYLYEGDYYIRKKANKIIRNSQFKNKTKEKLKEFLKDVEEEKLSNLIKNGKKYKPTIILNRIKKLNELKINPIPIPKMIVERRKIEELENLLTRARKIAEEKYFI